MNAVSFPFLIAWLVGAVLMVVGFINIAGPRRLREAYANWEFPPRFYLVAGVFEVTAAAFLAAPETRLWGIVFAGLTQRRKKQNRERKSKREEDSRAI